MILVGELSLWVALLMAAWSATVSFAGGAQGRADLIASGERGIYAMLAMTVLASLGLWAALVTHDFSLVHVASYTSSNLPLVYTLSAFWAGPAGALLLLALAMTVWSAAAVARRSARAPYAAGTLALIVVFVLALLCFVENPYQRLDWVPLDGRGMNPQLQNPAMTVHPPTLYFGLAATAVPFALAVSALLGRRAHRDWLPAARLWVLSSWTLLTAAMVLGMWWSYLEPGWNHGWQRDSLANASIFPWLLNSALLYSLRAEDRAGARLSAVLASAAFLAAIFAALVARGGIISVASALGASRVLAPAVAFLVAGVAACAYLLITRLREPGSDAQSRKSPASRARLPGRISAPLIYGGALIALAALGAQTLSKDHVLVLSPGESRELRDPFGRTWRVTSQGVSQYNELNRRVVTAALDVVRDGRSRDLITSELRQYVNSRGSAAFEPSPEPGIRGSVVQDMYAVLDSVAEGERASLRIAFHPFVIWVWIGGLVMVAGGLTAVAEATMRRSE